MMLPYLGDTTLQQPMLVFWAIPAIILLIWLISKTMVDVREDIQSERRRKRVRVVMTITRILIIILFCLALATPAVVQERTIQSDPSVTLLIDNSTSMAVFDRSGIAPLAQKLAESINVKIAPIGEGERSALGDAILSRVKKGDNVLLATDGRTTSGATLPDVSLFAANNNITLSALRLPLVQQDMWVSVAGPSKAAEGTETTFTVTIGSTGMGGGTLTVKIDNDVALTGTAAPGKQSITKTLSAGTHTITATIDGKDAFSQNNVYYKTVKVVPKPKVFFWSKRESAPLLQLYTPLYNVESGSSLPDNLAPYYTVILDDLPAGDIGLEDSSALTNFVSDGGGVVVVGGQNSFDRGGYGSSSIKNLLPVTVGSPAPDVGDTNIVVVMDASQSSSDQEGAGLKISRAVTLGVINDLNPKTRIGVVAFRNSAEVVSELVRKGDTADLQDKVTRIFGAGGSNMADGMQLAIDMLDKAQGSKNMIIISDGLLLTQVAASSKQMAQLAMQKGIKVFTIGSAVGDEQFIQDRVDEDLLKEIAADANGIYFRAALSSRLKLLFNPPQDKKTNESDRYAMVMDGDHYITQGVTFVDSKITGYNAILPKASGKLLVTTTTGEPLLVVWRLGLGRVAALGTDDGTGWNGPMLSGNNSAALVRTLNWAIGDPDRKEPNRIEISDGRLGEPLDVLVTADSPPASRETTLVRTGERTYKGSLTPTTIGFVTVLGQTAAVNAPAEYSALGESGELTNVVATSYGKFFGTGDADAIADLATKRSMQTVKEETPLRWPLAVLIFLIWFIELVIRRLLGKS